MADANPTEVWAVAGNPGPVDVRVFVAGVSARKDQLSNTPRMLFSGVPIEKAIIQNLDPATAIELGPDRSLVYGQGLHIPPNGVLANGALVSGLGIVNVLERFARLQLPNAGNPGRLVLLTDYDRGVWKDTGAQFVSVEGEVFNVKQFGAIGSGLVDDTGAVQAAINAAIAAGGGEVFFPPGCYKIVGGLAAGAATRMPLHFRGAGPASTLCNAGGALVDLLTLDSSAVGSGGQPFMVSDLAAYGLAGSRDVFVLNNAHRSVFRNVYIPGAGRYGMVLKSLLCTFLGVRWNQNDLNSLNTAAGAFAAAVRGLYGTTSSTALPPNTNSFIGCTFAGAGVAASAYGVYFDDGQLNTFVGGSVEGWNVGMKFTAACIQTGLWMVNAGGNLVANVQDDNSANTTGAIGMSPGSLTRFNQLTIHGANGVQVDDFSANREGWSVTSSGGNADIAVITAAASKPGRVYAKGASALQLGTVDGEIEIGRAGRDARFNRGFFADGQTMARLRQDSYTLANNAVGALFAGAAEFIGTVYIFDRDSVDYAIFFCRGTAHTTFKVADPLANYTNAAGGAGTTNIYWSAGNARYEIENRRGAQRRYAVFVQYVDP